MEKTSETLICAMCDKEKPIIEFGARSIKRRVCKDCTLFKRTNYYNFNLTNKPLKKTKNNVALDNMAIRSEAEGLTYGELQTRETLRLIKERRI